MIHNINHACMHAYCLYAMHIAIAIATVYISLLGLRMAPTFGYYIYSYPVAIYSYL